MKLLFYMGHPAHFHLFKNAIRILKENGNEIKILIKKKDILEDLIKTTGWDYVNINPRGRNDDKFSIALALLNRDIQFYKICRAFKPQMMLGTSAEITHTGKILGIPSVVVNEDDHSVVPLFAKLSYPFATRILAPHCCTVGKWEKKKIGYYGYHEVAYLHPKYFTPDNEIGLKLRSGKENYYILRFAKLGAHHDQGRTGITTAIAMEVIKRLEVYGNIYITSERELEPEFEKYRISIKPGEIHSALYFASLYIGDSQTMAAEAAVLGTPSIRFNDFAGQINYLEELELKFNLTHGISSSEPQKLYSLLDKLLADPHYKKVCQKKKEEMLLQCDDLTALIIKITETWPTSY